MVTSTNWYRTGTVSLTNGSNVVVGTNTYWLTAGLHPGDIFKVDGVDHEVYEITDNTHIKLVENYVGTTDKGKAYAIIRNFTATMPSEIAADITDLMKVYEQVRDGVYLTIQGESAYQLARNNGYVGTEAQWIESLKGKNAYQLAVAKGYVGTESEWVASLKGDNAYQVAVANGYTGTVEEWLESLKAAGEWETLNARTDPLTYNNAGLHNSIYRGKNLGEFTAAHWAAIRNGSFYDMWIGDYFIHNGKKDIIAAFGFGGNSNNQTLNERTVLLYRATPLETCDDYIATYNRMASGTEGEEDYDPGTKGNCYYESNWWNVVRPKFIEEVEATYSAATLKEFDMMQPVGFDSTGNPNGFGTLDSKAHLPSAGMVCAPTWSLADIARNTCTYSSFRFRTRPLPLTLLKPTDYIIGTAIADKIQRIRLGGGPGDRISTILTIWVDKFYSVWDTELGVPDGGHRLCPMFLLGV